jgi:NitT/TauT family transport system ATP-binding protein
VIGVRSVDHDYPAEDGIGRPALIDVNLEVADGEFVAIVGPSGCGKTTLLNLLAGLETVQSGSVELNGSAPVAGRADVGYMLARDCLLPWRPARENAALALEMRRVGRRERLQRAQEALESMGLARFGDHYPAQLSHGMRQRVALARVFAAAPQILLLDEPFSALDAQNRVLVQDAFLGVWERHRTTVVLITHDISEAVCLADRVVVMSAAPGRMKAIHAVDLPRPRSASELRSEPKFHQIYEAVWSDLRDEVQLAADEEAEAIVGA